MKSLMTASFGCMTWKMGFWMQEERNPHFLLGHCERGYDGRQEGLVVGGARESILSLDSSVWFGEI